MPSWLQLALLVQLWPPVGLWLARWLHLALLVQLAYSLRCLSSCGLQLAYSYSKAGLQLTLPAQLASLGTTCPAVPPVDLLLAKPAFS
jgi:hypothetical protein